MDEQARHYDKQRRVDREARLVFTYWPTDYSRRLVGANQRVFVDWAIPTAGRPAIISVPRVCWFSPLHNLLLNMGEFELFFEFMEYSSAFKTYAWYDQGMLPVSSVDLNGPGGQTLNICVYCLMKPEEDGWTLALRLENFSGKELPPARIGLQGTCYAGMESGSVLDPVNSAANSDGLLRGEVELERGEQRLTMANRSAQVHVALHTSHPFHDLACTKRGTLLQEALPLYRKSHRIDPLRQAVDFRVSCDVEPIQNTAQWVSFSWKFCNHPIPGPEFPDGSIVLSETQSVWTKRLAYLDSLETPDPLLTEALRRAMTYTLGCFMPTEQGVFAICSHEAFPIDCPRDIFAMASLLQYVEPQIAGMHVREYFLHLIPSQGLGCSYTAQKRATRERLLDLACYPFLELYRYRQITGGQELATEEMHRAVQQALTMLAAFRDDAMAGLIRSTRRSSDEKCVFPVFVPGNMLLVVALEQIARLLETLFDDKPTAQHCRNWATDLRTALHKNAVIKDPEFGEMWAFEIDGTGKYLLYDQADYPNLLTLPYFGFCSREDPIYRNTCKFIFSQRNAGYAYTADSKYAALCDGSKQDPEQPWALGILGELMAQPTPDQARRTYDWLENALSSGLWLSEAVEKHNGRGNGPPFGWATALMATLFIEIICGFRPGERTVSPCVPTGWQRFRSPVVKIRGVPMTLEWENGRGTLNIDGKIAGSLEIGGLL